VEIRPIAAANTVGWTWIFRDVVRETMRESEREKTMKNWECFCDVSYFGLWAVRPVGENRWGYCFHVQTKEEAEGLCDLLNKQCKCV
jgi:hypothetical protein